MKNLGYCGIGGGVVLIVISIFGFSIGGAAIGFLMIMCGTMCICLDDIYKLLDHTEKTLEQIVPSDPPQRSTAEEIIDQLRQEGLIRSGKPLEDEAIDDMLGE